MAGGGQSRQRLLFCTINIRTTTSHELAVAETTTAAWSTNSALDASEPPELEKGVCLVLYTAIRHVDTDENIVVCHESLKITKQPGGSVYSTETSNSMIISIPSPVLLLGMLHSHWPSLEYPIAICIKLCE